MDTLNQESDKYKSRHIHLDNGKAFLGRSNAWERLDGSGDVRFYDFQSQEESGTVAMIKSNRQATRTCRLLF